MLLALDVRATGDARPDTPAAEVLEKQWHRLMEALGDAATRLRSAQDAVAAAKLDPAKLEGDIKSLRAELDALQAQSEAKGDQLTEAKRHDGAAVVWSELAKQRAVVESARGRVADLHDTDRQSQDAMNQAEEKAKERDKELTDLVGRKNEIYLIPERPAGSKEPVLAVVSAGGVVFGRFDHPEKVVIEGFNLRAKFENELRRYSKADQYIVLYFRPSGVDNFDTLIDTVRKAGFEVGYDAVGEDTMINYNSVR
jgi:hypothetical protein